MKNIRLNIIFASLIVVSSVSLACMLSMVATSFIFVKLPENYSVAQRDKGPPFEILEFINSAHAFRGKAFDATVFFKARNKLEKKYSLAVRLVSLDGTNKIDAGQYDVLYLNTLPESKTIKVGNFKIAIPQDMPNGIYNIEMGLIKKDEPSNVITCNVKNFIEIKSYD
jgi:hypothetical protein